MDLNGKVALVTGGASGIGLACVNALLASGAKVAICDRNAKLGKEVIQDIDKKYGTDQAIFVEMDVRDETSFEEAFKRTKLHFKSLDIVLNSAGVFDEKEWEFEIDVNLKGALRGNILALKYLSKNSGGNGGVVVNIASVAALQFFSVYPIYSATKHGILAASKCFGSPFHYDLYGVRFITLCPSKTDTPAVKGAYKNVLKAEWEQFSYEFLENFTPVAPPENVANCFLRMIREAENGAVWVSEGDEMYLIKIPDIEEMKIKI